MDKPLLIKSVFMFIGLWSIGVILLWFRRNIEIFWKIVATLILSFYIWFFFEEISKGYTSFINAQEWYKVTISFLTELTAIIFTNLFFLWPLALLVIFYKADHIGALRLLKFMCILTLLLWILFVAYVYYDKGLNEFLNKNLKQMFPKLRSLQDFF
ncbi:MAG: hypothetical protein JXN64_01835 [Spirochaetes bacterium]|nr:hypothetical protein [Spirochaetota bacterium]